MVAAVGGIQRTVAALGGMQRRVAALGGMQQMASRDKYARKFIAADVYRVVKQVTKRQRRKTFKF